MARALGHDDARRLAAQRRCLPPLLVTIGPSVAVCAPVAGCPVARVASITAQSLMRAAGTATLRFAAAGAPRDAAGGC